MAIHKTLFSILARWFRGTEHFFALRRDWRECCRDQDAAQRSRSLAQWERERCGL
ncbi:MAG: hypothetical protein J0L51_10155 [Rhizobiales bacterium]|nr:hypothetical protein [Hyphomicrobiales bacterium]